MTSAVMDRAGSVFGTASDILSTMISKPPTRRQRIMMRLKKMRIPILIVSLGAIAGIFMRGGQNDSPPINAQHG